MWRPVQDDADVVVVEGLSPWPTKVYIGELNEALAHALDADVLLVGRWPGNGERNDDWAGPLGESAAAGRVAHVERMADMLSVTASGYRGDEQTRSIGCVVHGLPAADPPLAPQLADALMERMARSARYCTGLN